MAAMNGPAFDLDRVGGRSALRALVDEVLAAGEEALRMQRSGAGARYETKPDLSPVTEADQAVETRLRAFAAQRFPDLGFVGEEEGETNREAEVRFVVDPIDGTRAFIRGLPTWSVLVGMEDAHGPAVGIALMPAAGDLFVGVRGAGADGNGRPLHVSGIKSLRGALVAHGGLAQFAEAGLVDALPKLATETYTQRGFADFENYKQLLFGRADAVIDPGVKAWDICAAAVLVTEAGGRLTSIAGEDTIAGGSALATNGHLHDALVSLLAPG
ncbi:MAG: inositol monophosphatase family protein [Myxococcota bacterium]